VQLTSYTDYSLRALLFLMTCPDHKATTREMAEAFGVSLNHFSKVTKDLTKAGWLIGTRGGSGGVRLADHTLDTRIGDVVRHTENFCLVECFNMETNTCLISRCCRLKGLLYEARQAFFKVLDGATVREMTQNSEELRQMLSGVLPRDGS
jgi:Rrf2 family transcriptional regulator, nitric oxide-sensitive transcriptional repressor